MEIFASQTLLVKLSTFFKSAAQPARFNANIMDVETQFSRYTSDWPSLSVLQYLRK